jgi:hypothetical protein
VQGYVLKDIPMRTLVYYAIYGPLMKLLGTQPLQDIGPGVFKYRYVMAIDNPGYPAWAMTLWADWPHVA